MQGQAGGLSPIIGMFLYLPQVLVEVQVEEQVRVPIRVSAITSTSTSTSTNASTCTIATTSTRTPGGRNHTDVGRRGMMINDGGMADDK